LKKIVSHVASRERERRREKNSLKEKMMMWVRKDAEYVLKNSKG